MDVAEKKRKPGDSCHEEFGFVNSQDMEFWAYLESRGLLSGAADGDQ